MSAAELCPVLIEEIERVDDGSMAMAEVWRRVGAAADRLGLHRPSYEAVRSIVRERRQQRAAPSTGAVLLDVAFRAQVPEALLKQLSVGGARQLRRST